MCDVSPYVQPHDDADVRRADAMTVSPAAEAPRSGTNPMTRQGESTAMTNSATADVLDARDIASKDPLTLLRAIYVALDMLDDELGNDTDYLAAVGDVIAAKKHVMEAIDTLEHLYDDDARTFIKRRPLPTLLIAHRDLSQAINAVKDSKRYPAAIDDLVEAKKALTRGINKIVEIDFSALDARKPSELSSNASGRRMPSGRTRSEEVRAGGSDGRRAKLRAMLKSLLFAMDRHLLGIIGDFEAVALFEEDDEYKAWAKRLANELRRFREWIAIRTTTLDVKGDAP